MREVESRMSMQQPPLKECVGKQRCRGVAEVMRQSARLFAQCSRCCRPKACAVAMLLCRTIQLLQPMFFEHFAMQGYTGLSLQLLRLRATRRMHHQHCSLHSTRTALAARVLSCSHLLHANPAASRLLLAESSLAWLQLGTTAVNCRTLFKHNARTHL
jgi:hypothetical protein